MLLSLAASLLALAPQDAERPLPPHQLVAVEGAVLRARPTLLGDLGVDHAARRADGGLEFAASSDERDSLRRLGVPYRVLIDDLEAFYASRLAVPPSSLAGGHGSWLVPPFGSGAMGGYYTFTQVESVLDQIAASYPTIVAPKQSLGPTIEGRQLWMLKISDNPLVDENEPEVRMDAMHHAREPESMQVTLWFALWLCESYGSDPLATYLVQQREFYLVPVVNPDGYVYNQTISPGGGGMWRKNRRNNGGSFGVDLNRNWPEKWGFDDVGSSPSPSSDIYRGTAPTSEPEIQAMVAFCNQRAFRTSISAHTYSNFWMYPYGYAQLYPTNNAQYVEVSNLATEINHYLVGPPAFILYLANGITVDWDHNVRGTMSWTPEIGGGNDGFWPATSRIIPLAEENLVAYQRTALAAGAYLRPLSVVRSEVGDGDGFFEAGESVEWRLVVRNSGRAATNGSVSVGLSSSSPHVQITNGSVALGTIASFAQLDHPANPLRLTILPGAQGGTLLDIDVTISGEGYTQTLDGDLQVGEPVPFLRDTLEVDLGWTKGIVGDTATTGKWVRGDPIGTSNAGQPSNPEDDATPAPGVQAMVTGNGGGAAGNDDVDNGATTLLSPLFDLASVGPATLSYQRWFANLTNPDDQFEVSISNDGGTNWTPLETISSTANAWTPSSFRVSDHLAQTDRMRLRFVASDLNTASLVEAALDDLKVEIYDAAPRLNIYGTVVQGSSVRFNVTGPAGAPVRMLVSPFAPGAGPSWLGWGFAGQTIAGTIPSSRLAELAVNVPVGPPWAGKTFYFKALVGTGAAAQVSNWAKLTIP